MPTPSTTKKEPAKQLSLAMRLTMAQNEINAPKSRFNKFGGYKYRSAEDIFNAAKPVCLKYGLLLTVTDSISIIGDIPHIISTATITDSISSEPPISTTAYARIEAQKKGMDQSQLCGSASTYARKYALNGLFCIDDSADDPDTGTANLQASVDTAIKSLAECKSREEISAVYQNSQQFHQDSRFNEALKAACAKFPK